MHGELVGGASIRNGRVILKGNGQYLRTKPLTQNVREKTLEAWLYLPTLKQGAGQCNHSGSSERFDFRCRGVC